MTPHDYLPEMTNIARAAGALAMTFFHKTSTMDVQFKGQADLLCEADEAVETLIRDALSNAYPEIAFIGEESGHHGPNNAALTWIVDPIDGTTNFLSGLPFAISIALCHGNTPLAGVIYAPLSDDLYAAAQGRGATLNDTQCQVREEKNPARFVIGTGLPLDHYQHAIGAYERLHQLREQVAAIRIVGTCALSLAYVASGKLDGYFEGPTGFLDCAAGIIIVRESGGIVTDFWGTTDFPHNKTHTVGAATCQAFLLTQTQYAPKQTT